ncbi:diacylglycerol kinase zeta isoform X2 [Hydra vulgaris]|uniref:Diacylglycerol kinase n=1 Tax=Hydra vulgaris TaxID=6087 RepID=T2MDY5_HYDVU|nr:diacylglycerol kinase zeta isoform X2 [Hydra vulgaris]
MTDSGKFKNKDELQGCSGIYVTKTKTSHVSATRYTLKNSDSYEKAMSVPHCPVNSDHNEKLPLPDNVDWTVQAVNGTHIWHDTSTSGGCMLQDCRKSGPKKRCTACKFVAHKKCAENQNMLNLPKCRSTYREATPKGGVDILPYHHIVCHRKLHGRCDGCGKNIQSMLSYKTQREFIASTCSWCKLAYHTNCSPKDILKSYCNLGTHKNVILPPSWVVKLPPRKYSQTNSKRGRGVSMRRHSSKERRAFVIKPVDGNNKVMLLVFVNPRSGGNEGARILEKYQYLLNPRQVFDLSKGGPRFGLELFRKVPNIRILVCGGDGTVGWILSEIDKLKVCPAPPVAILPLGTGNDLSRFLGWGSGYTDEPLSKILTHVEEGEVQKLDRWSIDVIPYDVAPENCNEKDSEDNSVSKLPLSVMNNYYSMGADADVCLEFHESREANPERFKSRLKNLYFYGKKGSETIIRRKSKALYKCIENIICDDMDLTQTIKDLKPLCLIFLNISSYSAGTSPWGNPTNEGFLPQSCDDGYLEIIALTSASMVTTQVGGHGIRINQCQSAIIFTNTKISMQVDGEPCRLNPSKIHIKRRNQANMITKRKPHRSLYDLEERPLKITPKMLSTKLYYLTLNQYMNLVKYDIDEIKDVVNELCSVSIDPEWPLDYMRREIEKMKDTEDSLKSRLREDWCFLDATWTVRIYRIDEAQESLLYLGDILEGGLFVLDLFKNHDSSSQLAISTHNFNHVIKRPSSVIDDELSMNCERRNSLYLSTSDKEKSSSESESEESCDENISIPKDDNERLRAFLDAAQKGNFHQFKAIHQAGINLTVRDSSGLTPLHLASKNGQKSIVNYIIDQVESQSDKDFSCSIIDLVDNENHTPLHLAAFSKRRTICRKLIRGGASVTRQDTEGNTPQLLAIKAQDAELAKYLEKEERLQLIAADDHETAV